MRDPWWVLLLASLLVTGCLSPSGTPSSAGEPTSIDPRTGPSDRSEGSDARPGVGSRENGSRVLRFQTPVNISTEHPGAEPMLDVAPDGTIYVAGMGHEDAGLPEALRVEPGVQTVWRSTDGGASWIDVTPAPPTASREGADNHLGVAPDGTVYYGNAAGGTHHLFRSTDQGRTWEPLPIPQIPVPIHRVWIVAQEEGEIHLSVESVATFRNWHHGSSDHGTTWDPPTPMHQDPGFGSDMAAGPDGTLYIARTSLGSATGLEAPAWSLLVSEDDGLTWERRPMFEREGELTGSWQSLEVGPDGTLHMVWAESEGNTSLIHHAISSDGQVWSEPRPIAPVTGSQTLPWLDIHPSGKLGLVWYQTDQQGLPGDVEAPWYVAYAEVFDATSEDPTVRSTRVTPWTVHEGPICIDGPRCRGGRELADFTWIEFGPEGRAHLAFASTQWDKPSAFPVYAGESGPPPVDAVARDGSTTSP